MLLTPRQHLHERQAIEPSDRKRTFRNGNYVASMSGWVQLNSLAAKAQKIDDAVAGYLQKTAWETWQDYHKRLGDAAPGPKPSGPHATASSPRHAKPGPPAARKPGTTTNRKSS